MMRRSGTRSAGVRAGCIAALDVPQYLIVGSGAISRVTRTRKFGCLEPVCGRGLADCRPSAGQSVAAGGGRRVEREDLGKQPGGGFRVSGFQLEKGEVGVRGGIVRVQLKRCPEGVSRCGGVTLPGLNGSEQVVRRGVPGSGFDRVLRQIGSQRQLTAHEVQRSPVVCWTLPGPESASATARRSAPALLRRRYRRRATRAARAHPDPPERVRRRREPRGRLRRSLPPPLAVSRGRHESATHQAWSTPLLSAGVSRPVPGARQRRSGQFLRGRRHLTDQASARGRSPRTPPRTRPPSASSLRGRATRPNRRGSGPVQSHRVCAMVAAAVAAMTG